MRGGQAGMRILIVHNMYQQRGGEDAVVEAETDLLSSRGHEVRRYTRHNDDIEGLGRASAAVQAIWSTHTVRALTDTFKTWTPDVIHTHNTWSLVSPSIYWVAARTGIPTINTLHNFRLLCPQATFLRDNTICEDCLGHIPWRGALRGCYRGSRAQSTVLAGMLTLHQTLGTYRHKVTRYIALTEFARRKFIEGGLPETRISVKPNFVDFDPPAVRPRDGFLFVGRLSPEKGVALLAEAAAATNSTIRVAGTGPEDRRLAGLPMVQQLGSLGGAEVRTEMERATALVLPSICYENLPRTLVEAFACGLPVIAGRMGAMPELVSDGRTGLLFEPGDAADLGAKMRWAQSNSGRMAEMGRAARAQYEAEFGADRNYSQLMAIYGEAIDEVTGARA